MCAPLHGKEQGAPPVSHVPTWPLTYVHTYMVGCHQHAEFPNTHHIPATLCCTWRSLNSAVASFLFTLAIAMPRRRYSSSKVNSFSTLARRVWGKKTHTERTHHTHREHMHPHTYVCVCMTPQEVTDMRLREKHAQATHILPLLTHTYLSVRPNTPLFTIQVPTNAFNPLNTEKCA